VTRKPRIVPVAWLLLAITGMILSAEYFPLVELSLPGSDVLAILLLGLGVAMIAASGWQFIRSKTTVDPRGEATHLITGGLFRFSRNPIYLAMVLVLCGLALKLGSATPWLFVVAFAWIIQTRQIAWEERQLAAKFSDAYAQYSQRVRRWI